MLNLTTFSARQAVQSRWSYAWGNCAVEAGAVPVPDEALWVRRGMNENSFGAYHYASYILPPEEDSLFKMSRAGVRARTRVLS